MRKHNSILKLLSVVLVVTLIANPFILCFYVGALNGADSESSSPCIKSEYTKGDVNFDGVIDQFDYLQVKQAYFGAFELSDEQFDRADVNNDGAVDMFDYMLVKSHYFGIQLIKPTEYYEHNVNTVEALDPTCTENGNIAYYYCSECEKCFSDEACTDEIPVESTIIESDGHTLEYVTANDPDCYNDGNNAYYYCSECKKYFEDENGTAELLYSEIIITTNGHDTVTDAAVEPTCTQTGLTEGSHCSECNKVLVPQTEIPMKNHTPGAQATCTEDQICSVCYEVLDAANGHIPGVEATCTSHQICTVCSTVLAEATGHSLIYVPEKDPVDINDPGHCAYWQCLVCHKCYLDEDATQEIPLADTAWDTYLVYFFDLENDTYTVGAYKQSEVLSLKNIAPAEMKGYDFNGWHTGENFTAENKISVIPAGNTKNINLYANRSLHEYKITLLGLGREESWSYNIVNGITLTTPKWKESAGEGDCLIFSHWEDENGNEIKEIPAGEIGDRTIEANWIYKENYAVLNPDKYTYVNGVIDQYGRYSFIYEIGAIKNVVLSEQHTYTFDGLTEHTESETKTYTVGQSAGQEAATTISKIVSSATEMTDIETYTTTHTEGWEVGAKWKPEIEFQGIKVSAWEFSGGYSNTDTDTYEKTGFSSENNYEEDGTENEIRSTIDYYTEESVSRTVSDTFVPGVTPIGNYTWARLMDVKIYGIVTYNPYTDNYVFDVYSVPTNVHNGLLYTLPTELEYEVNIVSGDILSFEIPFEEIPEMFYTVEYNSNGGAGEMPKTVHELGVSSALFSNTFTKAGYTFTGWKTTANGSAPIYTDSHIIRDIASAGETVTLYAHWVPNTYTVAYNANGGSGSTASSVHTYDTAKTLTANGFSRTGYTFLGWSQDKNATSATYTNNASVKNLNTVDGATVTLYAVWKANTYTVTYKANGGSGTTSTSTHTYDVSMALTANGFTRSNHTFLGWSSSSSATTPTYTNKQSVKNLATSGNVTLYAVWIKTTAKVDFTSSNGYRDKTLGEGDSFTEIVSTGMNKSALIANGYSKVKITVVFDAKRNAVFNYNNAVLELIANGKVLGDRAWDLGEHFDNASWTRNVTKVFEINTSDLNPDGSFSLKWSNVDDEGTWSTSEEWYLGETNITVNAIK